MQTTSAPSRATRHSKFVKLTMGLGFLILSALLIQQVLAQNSPSSLKPPYHLNRPDVFTPDTIVPNPALNGPILVSQTFGSNYAPTSNLNAVGWHQVTGTLATIGYTWGRVTTGPHPNSAWVAATALNGEPALTPGTSTYPNGMEALLIYGPLDLSSYGDAVVSTTYFLDSRPGDYFGVAVSTDGSNFTALSADSSANSSLTVAHTAIYGLKPYARQSGVWLAFYFTSNTDGSAGFGAFVDDVVIRGLPLSKIYMPLVARQPTPTPTAVPYLYNYTFGSGASDDADYLKWGGTRSSTCYNGNDGCAYYQNILSSAYGHPGGAVTIYINDVNAIGGTSPNVLAPTNFEYSADLKVYTGKRDARFGLIFDASSSTFTTPGNGDAFYPDRNYYLFQLKQSKDDSNLISYYQVQECTNGSCGAVIGQTNLPLGLAEGQWNTLKVRQQGTALTFYLNGNQLATASLDPDWSTSRRKFGIYIETRDFNNSTTPFEVFFDNVRITTLP